jgi:AcrR family transcriptional regulator
MSRWAPNARERLEDAALDLFAENGYEQTTVAQIADRAGLNRATFFRHFADKREILFASQELLAGLVAGGIRDAAPGATLAECLQAALTAAGTLMTGEQRRKAAQRRAVAAASTEVQERGLLKQRAIVQAMTAALRERGTDDLTARLGADIALLAFGIALERWTASDDAGPFAPHAAAALDDLRTRVAALGSRGTQHAPDPASRPGGVAQTALARFPEPT